MARSDHIDDAAVEALLSGNGAGEELASLAAFVGELRGMASGPAPAPSPQLASMLAEGFSPEGGGVPAAAASVGGRRLRPAEPQGAGGWAPTRVLSGLNLGVKAAFSAALALAGITVAGAAGALPGSAQHVVATAVEAVTPFEFPDEADERAEVGRRVSTDATDGGVEGPDVADGVRSGNDGGGSNEGGGRPDAPGQAGLDRAGETPAAGHAPSSVPGGAPGTAGGQPTAPGGAGQDVVGGTPAAGQVPTTLPAGPPTTLPAGPPPTGRVPDLAPTVPTLPNAPASLPATLPTVPTTVPALGGRR